MNKPAPALLKKIETNTDEINRLCELIKPDIPADSQAEARVKKIQEICRVMKFQVFMG